MAIATTRATRRIGRLTHGKRRARREQVDLLRRDHGRHLLQRRDVHDVDGTTVRRRDQFMVARVNLQVVHRHGGQAGHEALPRLPLVHRHVGTDVRADEEQVRVLEILADHVHEVRATRRQGAGEARERGAEVMRRKDVRREIAAPVIVERDIERGRVEVRGLDAADVRLGRQAGEARAGDLLP